MTSEDVGNFFSEVPGVLVWLGVSADGKEAPALHSPHFRRDPAALAYGAALHVNLALEYLKG
jgi:IAA-amino acid hydrolase